MSLAPGGKQLSMIDENTDNIFQGLDQMLALSVTWPHLTTMTPLLFPRSIRSALTNPGPVVHIRHTSTMVTLFLSVLPLFVFPLDYELFESGDLINFM